MFSPEKMVSTIKKPAAVDIEEKKLSTIKKPEAVDIKTLRPILQLLSETIKFFMEKMGSSIIQKLESEIAGADIKDWRAMLQLSVGTVKCLSEKMRSIIKMLETKIIGGGSDVRDLIAMLQSLVGTMKFLSEAGVVGVDIKNLRTMLELLVETMKFLSEKMGIRIKKPTAEVVGVEIKELSRDGVTYSATVAVSNPYIIPIPIGELSYTLKSDGRFHLHPF